MILIWFVFYCLALLFWFAYFDFVTWLLDVSCIYLLCYFMVYSCLPLLIVVCIGVCRFDLWLFKLFDDIGLLIVGFCLVSFVGFVVVFWFWFLLCFVYLDFLFGVWVYLVCLLIFDWSVLFVVCVDDWGGLQWLLSLILVAWSSCLFAGF